MKKIVNKLKQNAKIITAFVLGAILTGGTVYAATVLPSSQVGYDNSTSGLAATDVQGALDELNTKANTWIDPTARIESMQNFDPSSIPNVGNSAIVYDARDGNEYIVRRLKDGKVWMTQNLRLINKTISSADSNVTSDFTIPASSVSGFDAQDTNNAYVDSTYGGYYTFYTATAGTGGTSLTSGNAPSSICPKGWRLPTGGSSGEFQTLYNNYNSSALMQGVPNFTLSGGVNFGSVDAQGSVGRFWSSTVYNANGAYLLRLSSSNVYPANSNDKSFGFSVRCMAI